MKRTNFTRLLLFLLCLPVCLLFKTTLKAQTSNYFPTLAQEEEHRRQQANNIQSNYCGSPKSELLSQLPMLQNMEDTERSVWDLRSSWGTSCTNDCIFTSPVNCGASTSKFRVPVVFTVSTTVGCSNVIPTEAEMQAQINIMNDFFACQGIPVHYYKSTTYTGHPATGDLSTRYGDYGCTYASGAVPDLPNVVNVYVFNDTGNGDGCNGFAPLPFSVSSSTRIVMARACYNGYVYTNGSYNCASSNLGLGQVFVHEFGHYLGLYHTHETDIVNNGTTTNECDDPTISTDDCTKGDGILDTDEDPNFHGGASGGEIGCTGCAVTAQSNCTFNNSSPACAAYGTPNTLDNIMSYNIYAGCLTKFSTCQKAKIMDALRCVRGLQVCSRDVTQEFAAGATATNLEICVGDAAPTFTATSNCYNWYPALGAAAVALATNSATFTPIVGSGIGQLNNNVPGVYTWYLGDLNEVNPNCRTTLTITVRAKPGTPTVNGGSSVTLGCAPTAVNLTTNITALSTDEILGWWFSSSPITISNQADLNTKIAAATVNGTLAAPMNHIFEATSGSPLKDLTKTFDCSTLGNGTYKVYPIVSSKRAAVAATTCTKSVNSSAVPVTNGVSAGVNAQGARNPLDLLSLSGSGCPTNAGNPTFSIKLTITGYTGTGTVGLNFRIGNCSSATVYSNTLTGVVAGSMHTFTTAQIGNYDPLTQNLCLLAWDPNMVVGTGTLTYSLSVTASYPGITAITFPSSIYSNCVLGTPVDVVCSCSTCTAPTISTQPSSTAACVGGTASFTVAATGGTTPYTYQWQKAGVNVTNGGAISGATTATLTINPIASGDAGSYTCIVTDNASCSVTSDAATLTVRPLPTATISGNSTICSGGTSPIITFTGAVGTAPYTFTYTINGGANQTIATSGVATTATVTASNTTTQTYTLVSVSDANSCTQSQSGTVTSTVRPLPTATISGNSTICSGGTNPIITFTGAVGTAPYTFTYTINGGANQTVATSGVATTATVTASNTTTQAYTLVSVSDVNGCTQSQVGTATSTVNSLPTFAITPTNPASCTTNNGSIELTGLTNGTTYTASYTFGGATVAVPSFTPATGNHIISGLAAGSYTNIIVTNTSVTPNCASATQSTTLTAPSAPTAAVLAGTATVCSTSANTNLTVTVTGGASPFTVVYSDGANQTVNSYVSASNIPVAPTMTTNYSLVSVTDLNGCTVPSASLTGTPTVTVKAVQTSTNGGNKSICQGGTTTALGGNTPTEGTGTWTSNAGGTFSPNANAPNATFTPLAATTGSVTLTWTVVNAPCTDAVSTLIVDVKATPTSTNGGNQTICQGGTTTALGGNTPTQGTGTWTSSTGGTFSPNANDPNATFTPLAATTINTALTWTVVNAPCTDATSTLTIIIVPTPTAASTTAISDVCLGSSVTLTGNNPVSGTGAWSVITQPAGSALSVAGVAYNGSIMPTVAGAYTLRWTISASPCSPSSADVNFTIKALPVVQNITGGTATRCAGSAISLVSSEVGVSYQLQNNSVNTGAPAVSAAVGSLSFPNQNTAGVYTVVATSNGCTATMNGAVTIVELPTKFDLTASGSYCAGTGGLPLNLSGSQNGVSYQLKNGAVNVGAALVGTGAALSFGNHTAGVYTVVATSTSGVACSETMNGTVTLTENPIPTFSTSKTDPTTCSSNNGKIDLTGLANSTAYTVSYSFNGVAVPAVAFTSSATGTHTISSTLAAGAYTNIIVTNTSLIPNCSSAPATVNLVAPSAPTAATLALAAGAASTICSGTSTNLKIDITGGTANYTVVYAENGVSQPAITNYVSGTVISLSPTVNTTYTLVSVTDNIGCAGTGLTGSVPITVVVPPDPAQAGNAATICSHQTHTLAAVAASPSPAAVGTWSVSSGPNTATTQFSSVNAHNAVFTPTAGGTYILRWTVTTAAPCSASTSEVTITVNPTPVVTPVASVNVCSGKAINIPLASTPAATVDWTNDNAATGIAVSGTGNITATAAVTAAALTSTINATATLAGCTNGNVIFNVNVNPEPVATLIPSGGATVATPICPLSPLTLTASGGTSYNWGALSASTGASINILAAATSPTTYTVTVTNASNCTSVATTTVYTQPIGTAGCFQALIRNRIIINAGGTFTPRIWDPCTCIGNNIFAETVVVESLPGEVWTIAAGTTLLDPATMLPYPVGTPIPQLTAVTNAAGNVEYRIDGRHMSGVGYVLNAFNAVHGTLTISNLCNAAGSGASLICQDNVNISMPAACNLLITPNMILSSAVPASAQVTIVGASNPLNYSHVGKTFTVKITDGCDGVGNSCWGTIKVEDKQAPVITLCADITVKCSDLVGESTTTASFSSEQTIGAVKAPKVEECSGKTLTYADVVTESPCVVGGAYITKKIVRTYTATDAYGNKASCIQNISFERPNLVGATLTAAKKQFDCSATFAKDANGNPTAGAAGVPVFTLVGGAVAQVSDACDLTITYTDVKTPICGTGFEIIRKWLVIDLCDGAVFTTNQVIEIKDISAPVITGTTPDLTISTSTTDCFSNGEINIPSATDNCDNSLTYSAIINNIGYTITAGKVLIKGLSVGNYTLTWTATDDCGNSATKTQIIAVQDLIAPVAVCDLNTKVALTSDGSAKIFAVDIDNGSLDNCCFDVNSFEIKRATEGDAAYAKFLNLNCNDKTLMVAMRVKDCFGQSNICMTNVLVEDKLPPVIFAKDNVVECGSDIAAIAWLDANKPTQKLTLSDYPTASNPGWYDNCGGSIDFVDKKGIDNCGNGTFIRTWTVTDANGFSATTVQRFISTNKSAFSVTFPADIVLTTPADCKDFNLTPTGLNSKPTISALNNNCPLVGLDYTDEVFDIVGDTICQKILRTWKSLNWCAPASGLSSNPTVIANNANGTTATADAVNNGFFQYTQIIKVVDKVGPVLGTPKTPKLSSVGKECKVALEIEKINVSDCGSPSLSWAIIGSNNVELAKGISFPIKYTFVENQFGTYTVRYTATDNCGNYSSTDQTIKVTDKTKPTPICHNGLSIQLMANGMVMVDAKNFDAGSYDNCTAQNKLKFKIQVPSPTAEAAVTMNPDTMKTSYTFTCPPVGTVPDSKNPNSYIISVALWVGDEYGNWDYCETYAIIEDNMDICGYAPIQMKPLAGEIKTEKEALVENVMLKLDGTKKMDVFSAATGKFQFNDLPVVGKYNIVPEKDVYPMNGISTIDLILISKHILGVQSLATPYQHIAADVNKSNSVSTADIVELRKMILGTQSNFTKNTSWRFVDKVFSFPADVNPLATNFPETIAFDGISNNSKADFIAVKIGDISGNAVTNVNTPAVNRAKNTLNLNTNDQTFQTGEEVKMNFRMSDIANINGYQFTFEYDKNVLELVEIQGDKDNFGAIENGILTTSAVTYNNSSEDVFNLVFRAKRSGNLSNTVKITSAVTNNSAYSKDGEELEVKLNFNNSTKLEVLELHQNRPNPFSDATIISFNLPQSGQAILTITDATGRVVKRYDNAYAKGYNEIKINKNELGAKGVLYYQLEQNGQKANRKLVVIE